MLPGVEKARRHLVADLRPMEPPATALELRHPTDADAEALAVLMLDAYTGTIDYDGEDLDDARAEVAAWMRSGGRSSEHSFVAADRSRLVSAILVGIGDGMPVISYVMTAASYKGRGFATGLMQVSMASLHAAGYGRVELWVTVGNEPAEGIYERLGFRDVAV